MKNRILALTLAMLLAVSLMPAAFAAVPSSPTEIIRLESGSDAVAFPWTMTSNTQPDDWVACMDLLIHAGTTSVTFEVIANGGPPAPYNTVDHIELAEGPLKPASFSSINGKKVTIKVSSLTSHIADVSAQRQDCSFYIRVFDAPSSGGNGNNAIYIYFTHHLTLNANGGTFSSGSASLTVNENKDEPFYDTNYRPTRSGYTFAGWNTASNGTGTKYTPGTTPVTADVTLYAQWTANSSSSSSSGGGGGSSSPAPASELVKPAGETPVAVKADVAPTVTDKTATASVSADIVNTMLTQAQTAAETGTPVLTLNVAPADTSDVTTVKADIPAAAFASVAETEYPVSVDTGSATLTLDPKTVGAIAGADNGDVSVSVAKVDVETLSDDVKEIVGDRPVFDFTITNGNTQVHDLGGGTIEVGFPYTLGENENPSNIVMYYLADDGTLEIVRGSYKDGVFTAKLKHLSTYAVAYNAMSFTDVDVDSWYGDAVAFVAARGITKDIADASFLPEQNVTRAEFLVMLMRAYGIAPDSGSNNFSDAGNTYYTKYLSAAKQLGIIEGIGDNKFAPDNQITRQEMFKMLHGVLVALQELPSKKSGLSINNYTDTVDLAAWAAESIADLVERDVCHGDGNGKLLPGSKATRSQAAQIVQNLMA